MNDRQIIVHLITRTGLHIGSGSGNSVTDALVRRDARGDPVIPGTGLAGALRTLATRLAPRLKLPSQRPHCKALDESNDGKPCGCIVCQLFGDINPKNSYGKPKNSNIKPEDADVNPENSTETQAKAARLWVYDAHLSGTVAASIRDGVGIDRTSGAAYRQGSVKFDTEILPPGTKFDLRLELESSGSQAQKDAEEQLLAAVLSEWLAGRGALGGRVSRGLGAIAVRESPPVVYRQLDFTSANDLYAYLVSDDPWGAATTLPDWLAQRRPAITLKSEAQTLPLGVARTWVRLRAEIQATGAFLVNDPVSAAASGFDHAPLLAAGRPLLPGSSIKGVLRSQAERIARTLATHNVKQGKPFLEHCPACNPLVGNAETALANCDSLLRAQSIISTTQEAHDEHLCLACRLFGSSRRGSRLRVADAPLIGEPVYKPRDFLAIDRFTGGGADQFKFDAAVLWQPRFKINLFLENPEPWELGWLWLALRDIHDGLATLGFGAAKGFGRVRAKTWNVDIGFLASEDIASWHLPATEEVSVDGLYQVRSITQQTAKVWATTVGNHWVKAFTDQVNEFERDAQAKKLPELKFDSYFGTPAEDLYPVEEGAL